MKKRTFFSRNSIAGKYPLFLLKMKLLIVLLVLNLQVSAAAFSQVKVSVELRKTTLGNAIKVLEQKTGFRFVYNNEVVPVNKVISINVSNTEITKVLDLLLDKLPLTYKIIDNKMIVIVEKQDALFIPEAAVKVTVTGKVVDEHDQPLSGVTVTESGNASVKTVTDANGVFSLEVTNAKATLTFGYVGFITQTVAADGKEALLVKLAPENNKLNEVVVVGYGTQRSTSLTGSIAKVDVGGIAKLSTTSVDQQMAGRAAGVQVTVNSGSTNATPRIRIRGLNSINNGSDPLIVVDGVPVNTGDMGGYTATNALADINPNDITSMEVLKDGAATAIYGSRAANGVLLITTRHGVKGNTKVNYDTYVAVANPVKKAKLLNATEFVTITNEKYANSGEVSPAAMDANNTNTDWQSLVYNKNAFSHSHNIGISGANDKTNFFFSANYLDQQGAIQRNTTSRYGIRANVDHQVNKFIKIGTNTSLTRLKNIGVNNSSGLSSVIINSLIALPNVSPYDATSTIGGYNVAGDGKSLGAGANEITIDDAYPNILFSLNNDQYNIEKYRILSNAYIELNLLPGLKFRSQGSVDLEQATDFYSLDARHGDGYSYNGLVKNTSFSRTVYNLQNYFTYNKRAGDHNFTFTAGNEIQKNVAKSAMAGGSDFSNYFFQTKNLISGSYTTQLSGGSYTEGSFMSYFGRLNYDFAGKYLLGLTLRRDGLSSLAQPNRYGVFPGVSAGWRVSEEGFWKQTAIDRIASSFKIRGSYGKVGNTLSGFPYLSTYGGVTYGSENGLALTNVGNSSLTWETSKKLDAGFDAGFLNNRITLTFDWFRNDIDNLVMNVTYPNSYGVPDNSVARNIGAMVNDGFEISLGADVVKKKNFNWNVNANFTRVKNKVTRLYNGQALNNTSYRIAEGLPLYAMIGYRYAGVNETNGNPLYYKGDGRLIQGDIASQKYYFASSKQDVALTDATTLTDADKAVLGNPTPTWYGGVTNTFTYGNFSVEAFVRFSGGNSIDNSLSRTLLNQKFKNNGTEILNRWTPTHTQTDVPKLWYGRESFINLSPSSRWIEKGDYLRLQNLTFSYNLPKEVLAKMAKGYLSSFRVYVQGQNLLTATGFKGLDPDLISETGTSGTSIPVIRSFSVGLNVGF